MHIKGPLYSSLTINVNKWSCLPVVKLCGKLHVQIQIKIVREPFQQPTIHPVYKGLVDYWHKEIIQNSIKYNI